MSQMKNSTEECVRVRVSLERFFSDERARVYMCARSGRSVSWLTRRLQRAFPELPARLALVSRSHLLPPDEPLLLLHHDDPLEVIPATTDIGSKTSVRNGGATDHTSEAEDASISVESQALPGPKDVPDAVNDITLLEMKRQALQMLEQYEGEEAPPRRRRRRVRRRRRGVDSTLSVSGAELSDARDVMEEHAREPRDVSEISERVPRDASAMCDSPPRDVSQISDRGPQTESRIRGTDSQDNSVVRGGAPRAARIVRALPALTSFS